MTAPAATKTVASAGLMFQGQALDPKFMAALLEVKVRLSLFAPDLVEMRFSDPEREFIKSRHFKFGEPVEIFLGAPDKNVAKSVFKGMVAALEPQYAEDGVVATLRAYDYTFKLTRGRHTRVFTDILITDAIWKVLWEAGFEPDVTTSNVKAESLQQSEESDWDFLTRLLRMVDYVMIPDGKQVRVGPLSDFAEDVAALQFGPAEEGKQLYSFSPTMSAGQVPEKVVVVAQEPLGGSSWTEEIDTFSEGVMVESGAAPAIPDQAKEFTAGNTFRYATTAWSQLEVRTIAKSVAARLLQTVAQCSGVAQGRPDLQPAARIDVQQVDQFSGKYIITEAMHVWRGMSGYRVHFVCAGNAPRTLAQVVVSRSSTKTGGFGEQMVIGIVTNNQDPENLGRVRIKFPTVPNEDTGNTEGWWARIASPSTGKERGLLMLPQIDEEVIVGFEHGDVSRPIVLGSLWNQKQEPGEDVVKQDGSFSLKSDKQIYMKAKEDIEVHTDEGHTVKIGKDSKTDVDGKWEQKVGKEVQIENGMFPITIKSGKEIRLSAPMISVEADMKLELKSSMVNITGTGAVVIDGGIIKLG